MSYIPKDTLLELIDRFDIEQIYSFFSKKRRAI